MKFQVGDRVCAYNCSKRYVGHVIDLDDRHVNPPLIVVQTVDDTLTFNAKQCRKLKKKPKPKPSRVWIKGAALMYSNVMPCQLKNECIIDSGSTPAPTEKEWREFVEVCK